MTTLEQRITEAVKAHRTGAVNSVQALCMCDSTWRSLAGHDSHVSEALAAAIAPAIKGAQAEALESEARNLRELHTLIEHTPWNPMPADEKKRCINFMAESGVDDHEYTDRHLNNYAAWLDHRAEQIRSNDE